MEVSEIYLIAKQQGGYQAIPIKVEDRWDFSKLLIGKQEVRIILRLRGRRHLLYHTRDLVAKYPLLRIPQLTILCDEIIAKTSECIERGDDHIDFEKIAAAAQCRHQRRWREQGLITPTTPEQYQGHPIDPQTEILSTQVQVDQDNIIMMDHEPPADIEQEELPY